MSADSRFMKTRATYAQWKTRHSARSQMQWRSGSEAPAPRSTTTVEGVEILDEQPTLQELHALTAARQRWPAGIVFAGSRDVSWGPHVYGNFWVSAKPILPEQHGTIITLPASSLRIMSADGWVPLPASLTPTVPAGVGKQMRMPKGNDSWALPIADRYPESPNTAGFVKTGFFAHRQYRDTKAELDKRAEAAKRPQLQVHRREELGPKTYEWMGQTVLEDQPTMKELQALLAAGKPWPAGIVFAGSVRPSWGVGTYGTTYVTTEPTRPEVHGKTIYLPRNTVKHFDGDSWQPVRSVLSVWTHGQIPQGNQLETLPYADRWDMDVRNFLERGTEAFAKHRAIAAAEKALKEQEAQEASVRTPFLGDLFKDMAPGYDKFATAKPGGWTANRIAAQVVREMLKKKLSFEKTSGLDHHIPYNTHPTAETMAWAQRIFPNLHNYGSYYLLSALTGTPSDGMTDYAGSPGDLRVSAEYADEFYNALRDKLITAGFKVTKPRRKVQAPAVAAAPATKSGTATVDTAAGWTLLRVSPPAAGGGWWNITAKTPEGAPRRYGYSETEQRWSRGQEPPKELIRLAVAAGLPATVASGADGGDSPALRAALAMVSEARRLAEKRHTGAANRKLGELIGKMENPAIKQAIRKLMNEVDDASYSDEPVPLGVWFEELAELIRERL